MAGGVGCEDRGSDRVLTYSQVVHLQRMIGFKMRLDPKGSKPASTRGSSNPTLTMTPLQLIQVVLERLGDAGIPVKDVRINGSAASCVVAGESGHSYNDLDVLFNLSGAGLRGDDPTRHDKIRSAALSALVEFFPSDYPQPNQILSTEELSETYVHKMVKIENSLDRWSLISLQNHSGPNIELKFVDSMRRKYQFSIDSFQVIIDSYLLYRESSTIPMNERFFPTVVAQTFYGNFDDALDHLRNKLIATNNPEEIRGGGLLKYCGLLACNYKPAENVNAPMLERYMCARFFIDFPTIELQRVQLHNYLANHCVDQEDQRGLFLVLAINVIQRSAFCLPAHERETTLKLIHQMAIDVTFFSDLRAYSKQQEMNIFDQNVEYHPTFSNTIPRSSAPRTRASVLRADCCQCAYSRSKKDRFYAPVYVYPVFFRNTMVIPDTN